MKTHMGNIEFFKHNIGAREIRDVSKTLRDYFLTTGKHVEEFERRFAAYLGLPYAVGVTSCTAALQLSLTALGVKSGDEVITTPMSFAATALAVLQASAVPVFVDVEAETGNLDAALVEKAVTPRTKAILPVHLYGQLCDMRALRRTADCHGLVIVEDAAHAIEARRDGAGVGELGDAACFSFYPTKSITCGEGGAVATKSEEVARTLRCMRHHGMSKSAADRYGKDDVTYEIAMMGWKYNMDNIQASLLLGQLERVEILHGRRDKLARYYWRKLSGAPGIKFMKEFENARHARHLFTILVPAGKRPEFVRRMKERGIGVSINYIPIHLQKFFRETYGYKKGDFPTAEAIGASTVSLPLYPKLKLKEAETVVQTVIELVRELKFDDF